MNRIAIVGGCGHVGIPLGLALASKGFQTTLIDMNSSAVECILGGKLPFQEEGAEQSGTVPADLQERVGAIADVLTKIGSDPEE